MSAKFFRLSALTGVVAGLSVGLTPSAVAEQAAQSGAALAQELTNPIANIVTVPIQMNYDQNYGVNDDGSKLTTNVQPVIPFQLNDEWNLITRTIVPVIHQDKLVPGEGSQFGLGDIMEQLFFSPQAPAIGGINWGVGAVMLLPTATDSLIGSKKWGAGPAFVALKLAGPWTIGGLANHVWSFAGDEARADISNTLLQPFVAYTWPSAWTVSAQSESTYNWKQEQWSVPVNFALAKMVKFGAVPVSLQAGVGRWLQTPETGPEGLRFRLQANIVLPK